MQRGSICTCRAAALYLNVQFSNKKFFRHAKQQEIDKTKSNQKSCLQGSPDDGLTRQNFKSQLFKHVQRTMINYV